MMIISVGGGEHIARVVPRLGEMLRQPLLTIERIRVCKRDGELLAHPDVLPMTDEAGPTAVAEADGLHVREPPSTTARPFTARWCANCATSGAASGATVLRGIWGFHGGRKPHGDKLIQLSRQVPVTTIIVDRPDRIARSLASSTSSPANTGW